MQQTRSVVVCGSQNMPLAPHTASAADWTAVRVSPSMQWGTIARAQYRLPRRRLVLLV